MNISEKKLYLIWQTARSSDNPTVEAALDVLINATLIAHGVEIEKKLEEMHEELKPSVQAAQILARIRSKK